MNLVASIKDNGNYGLFNVNYYTTGTIRTLASGKAYLNRNVTIVPANAGAITSPVTVRLYITSAEYNALKAADTAVKTIASLQVLQIATNTCQTTAAGPYSVILPTGSGVFGTFANGYYVEFSTSTFGTFFIAGPGLTSIPAFGLTSFTGVFNGGINNLVTGARRQ